MDDRKGVDMEQASERRGRPTAEERALEQIAQDRRLDLLASPEAASVARLMPLGSGQPDSDALALCAWLEQRQQRISGLMQRIWEDVGASHSDLVIIVPKYATVWPSEPVRYRGVAVERAQEADERLRVEYRDYRGNVVRAAS